MFGCDWLLTKPTITLEYRRFDELSDVAARRRSTFRSCRHVLSLSLLYSIRPLAIGTEVFNIFEIESQMMFRPTHVKLLLRGMCSKFDIESKVSSSPPVYSRYYLTFWHLKNDLLSRCLTTRNPKSDCTMRFGVAPALKTKHQIRFGSFSYLV